VSEFVDRVAVRASTVDMRAVVLSVLVFPFWLLGALVGLVWAVVRWVWAAVCVGFSDGSSRVNRGAG
jgi:hypothetical protein